MCPSKGIRHRHLCEGCSSTENHGNKIIAKKKNISLYFNFEQLFLYFTFYISYLRIKNIYIK